MNVCHVVFPLPTTLTDTYCVFVIQRCVLPFGVGRSVFKELMFHHHSSNHK